MRRYQTNDDSNGRRLSSGAFQRFSVVADIRSQFEIALEPEWMTAA